MQSTMCGHCITTPTSPECCRPAILTGINSMTDLGTKTMHYQSLKVKTGTYRLIQHGYEESILCGTCLFCEDQTSAPTYECL